MTSSMRQVAAVTPHLAPRGPFGLPRQWWSSPIKATRRIGQSLVLRWLRQYEVVVHFGGSRVVVDLRTPLGLQLYRYGYWEDTLDHICKALAPGGIFIDGGANIGLMSVVGAQRVGSAGRVISLEPASATRRLLERNVVLGHHANVIVLPWALGEKTEQRQFTVIPDHLGLSSFSPSSVERGFVTTVTVRPLDEIVEPEEDRRVRLVKLDVEGAELAALKGARRLLARSQAEWLVEVDDAELRRQGASAREVFALFHAHGFTHRHLQPPNVLFSPGICP
jgi:FkbM family methyltransferase